MSQHQHYESQAADLPVNIEDINELRALKLLIDLRDAAELNGDWGTFGLHIRDPRTTHAR